MCYFGPIKMHQNPIGAHVLPEQLRELKCFTDPILTEGTRKDGRDGKEVEGKKK